MNTILNNTWWWNSRNTISWNRPLYI